MCLRYTVLAYYASPVAQNKLLVYGVSRYLSKRATTQLEESCEIKPPVEPTYPRSPSRIPRMTLALLELPFGKVHRCRIEVPENRKRMWARSSAHRPDPSVGERSKQMRQEASYPQSQRCWVPLEALHVAWRKLLTCSKAGVTPIDLDPEEAPGLDCKTRYFSKPV